ncbi:signal peptidase I [Anoxybacillus rupiensis]|jgi:signal peptidase I|uniref:Signal peptidase I n=1 Tax=Anoxybacteroides rupiense TaxID=311460 RepID=A0ABD5J092_9BACL|nr:MULTISPECIES: signal peptidase I [Anoxybacillus]KXG09973.1 Signal peptidase I P [Anoxybacillus sp. P3H1B]MBB3907697.1 signal peptidase I [Anoxybacillus rupiensis]MBS2771640.1 signal peptidase I [Anoxybacillus rupiensis]MDE8564271.1 signal peptidase I [Anoxybacillus rupiensis]MED5053533.1 signal peptidase I [Anoxybacillus rupiensis]
MSNWKEEIVSWGKAVGIAVIIAVVVRNLIFAPYIVKGESMLPTLQNDNRLIVSKFSKWEGYKHFDIIVFNAPDSKEKYIKRIIGLPGDTVEMKHDTLYINGKAYNEPYLKTWKEKNETEGLVTGDFTLQEITNKKVIPKGYVFVLGDNRLVSKDSRYFGLVPMKDIVGKAVLRIWPVDEAGLVK